jgi:hypothetical protein
MNAEKFWLGWLKVTMILMITGGIILVLFSQLVNSYFLNAKIDKVFFNDLIFDENLDSLKNWYTGVTGAVMMGWGFAMLYVVNHPLRRKELWAWRSMFYPVLAWYILDSGISAYYGVVINMVINTVFFLQIMAPLLFLRNQFNSTIKVAT